MVQQQQQQEEVFVQTMDHVDGYLELQNRLKEALSKGLFSLAQAKYSMGLIGQQQYDMDMKASATVTVMEEADSDSMYSSFQLHRQGGGAPDSGAPRSSSNGAAAGTGGAAGSGREQAVDGAGAKGSGSPGPGSPPAPASAGTASHIKDPLAWFGVMVPPPLKAAQRSFKETLELCIQLANCSQRIREGIDELQQDKHVDQED